ncbi:hypothetical protein [Microbacterium sp. GXF6406]
MLNTIAADGGTPEKIWHAYAARRALNDAVCALEGAGAALASLVEQTMWQAQGVRELNLRVTDAAERTAFELSELAVRIGEIDRVVGA